MNFSPTSLEELRERIAKWRSRDCSCSNLFKDAEPSWQFAETENALLLRVREHEHFRVFFIAKSLCGLRNSLANLDATDGYVINVPARGDIPTDLRAAIEDSGFNFFASYHRRTTSAFPQNSSTGEFDFARADESKLLLERIHEVFSTWTDYVPAKSELEKMVEENRVLVHRENGRICAFAVFSISGKNAT